MFELLRQIKEFFKIDTFDDIYDDFSNTEDEKSFDSLQKLEDTNQKERLDIKKLLFEIKNLPVYFSNEKNIDKGGNFFPPPVNDIFSEEIYKNNENTHNLSYENINTTGKNYTETNSNTASFEENCTNNKSQINNNTSSFPFNMLSKSETCSEVSNISSLANTLEDIRNSSLYQFGGASNTNDYSKNSANSTGTVINNTYDNKSFASFGDVHIKTELDLDAFGEKFAAVLTKCAANRSIAKGY